MCMFTICLQRLLSALITRLTPSSSSTTNGNSNGSSNHSSSSNTNNGSSSDTDAITQSDGLNAYDRDRIAALFDLRETDYTRAYDNDIYNDISDTNYWEPAAAKEYTGSVGAGALNGNLATDMADEMQGHIDSITIDQSLLLLQPDSSLLKSHSLSSDNNFTIPASSSAPASSSFSLSRTALHKALLYSSLLHLTDLVHLLSSSSSSSLASSSASSHAPVSYHQKESDQSRVPTIFSYTPTTHIVPIPLHPSMSTQAFLPYNGCNLPRMEHLELPSPLSLLEMNDIPTLPATYWTAWRHLEEHWARGDEGSELGRLTRVMVRELM